MRDSFLVITQSKAWRREDPGLIELLRSERLYKSLSLLLAADAGLTIPASLLLLTVKQDFIARFADEWGYPLMIRVDYRKRPQAKPIGGIPLYELQTMLLTAKHLLTQGCVPLFHPNVDRFKDLYSVGVLLSSDSDTAEVEVVGKGFDAGDLRLGKTIPHESFQVDLVSGTVSGHKTVADDVYRRERSARATMIRKLKWYVDFANQSARLLPDLGKLDPDVASFSHPLTGVPLRYEEMPKKLSRELLQITRTVRSEILESLPPSKVYVASLSYLAKEGWVLWDVYGDWYQR